jgi:hypothetical protein
MENPPSALNQSERPGKLACSGVPERLAATQEKIASQLAVRADAQRQADHPDGIPA